MTSALGQTLGGPVAAPHGAVAGALRPVRVPVVREDGGHLPDRFAGATGISQGIARTLGGGSFVGNLIWWGSLMLNRDRTNVKVSRTYTMNINFVTATLEKYGLSDRFDAGQVLLNMSGRLRLDDWKRLGRDQMGQKCGRGCAWYASIQISITVK